MQNKGAITFFAILLALASIYQLSFTFATWNVKKDAEEFAGGDYSKESYYLDSVSSEPTYPLLGLTFKECQKREINLGLDLKGGMNVILEVSVVDLVKAMSDNSKDSTFRSAIRLAEERQEDSQEDFISLFYEAFKEVDANAKLGAIFGTYALKDRINFNTPDEEILDILREEATDAIDNSLNVLRSRIDRFGVVQPTIQKLEGNSGRILVELPGIKEPKRVRKLLQGTADLQFWETYYYPEIYSFFITANNKMKEIRAAENPEAYKDTAVADTSNILDVAEAVENDTTLQDTSGVKLDDILNDTLKDESVDKILNLKEDSLNNELKEKEGFDNFMKEYPLFAVLRPYVGNNNQPIKTAAVGFAHQKDTAKVNEILNLKQIKQVFPRELSFAWEVKAFDDKGEMFKLIALKSKKAGQPALSGDVITGAREETDNVTGEWQVSMSMDAEGTQKWALITKENIGKQIAIVLDGYVYSYPVVNSEIKGGSSSISGNFSQEEANDLSNILKSGKLPAPAYIIEEEVVGPSLGNEAVNAGFISFILGFVVILVYMFFFYKSAGLVADIALLANILFIFGVLASLGAVLTLPGIAGIVLTIGMSVDANVLIYERIKEEMKRGKGLKLALSDGYKHAYSAIIDANLTTLITGIILYIFGHGPIKGFATTLIIGILTSLFSAIFISRLIFATMLSKNKNISFFNKITENAFKNTKIDFISKRKTAYIISGIVIVSGLVSLFVNGLNFGVDFKGGRTYVVRFEKPVNTTAIAEDLKAVFDNETPEVKTYGQSNQVKIVTKYLIDNKDSESDNIVETKLYEGLKAELGTNVSFDEFLEKNRQSSRKVGPTIADDIKVAALWSVMFSLIAIFLYIFGRFRNWQFGLGAIAALTHDVLIVIGLFSLLYPIMPFSLEINQAFIAAILTVVGYSVNDTVVVFDRIREYLSLSKSKEKKTVYNEALNSTVSRTFNTSISTFFVLLAIFIFGGEVIQGFVFALLIGVIVGTYSSLFIATPVVFDTVKKSKTQQKIIENQERRETKKKSRDYRGKKKRKSE